MPREPPPPKVARYFASLHRQLIAHSRETTNNHLLKEKAAQALKPDIAFEQLMAVLS